MDATADNPIPIGQVCDSILRAAVMQRALANPHLRGLRRHLADHLLRQAQSNPDNVSEALMQALQQLADAVQDVQHAVDSASGAPSNAQTLNATVKVHILDGSGHWAPSWPTSKGHAHAA